MHVCAGARTHAHACTHTHTHTHTRFLGENIDVGLRDLGLDNGDFLFLFLDTVSEE